MRQVVRGLSLVFALCGSLNGCEGRGAISNSNQADQDQSSAERTTQTTPAVVWAEREIHRFEVNSHSQVNLGERGDTGLGVSGTLELAVTGQTPFRLRARLINAKLLSGNQLPSNLDRPIEMQGGAGGEWKLVSASAEQEAPSTQLLLSLTSALQLPNHVSQSTTHVEADPSGEYEARYSVVDPHRLTRQKIAYKSIAVHGSPGQQERLHPPSVEASQWTIDLAKAVPSRVDRVQGSDTIKLSLNLGTEIHGKVDATLQRVPSRAVQPEDAWLQAPLIPAGPAEGPLSSELLASLDRIKIGNWTVSSTLDLLGKASQTSGAKAHSSEEERSAFTALVAMVRLDQQRAVEVANAARSGHAGSSAALSALGQAGTAGAQAVLVGLAQDSSLPDSTQQGAWFALSRVDHPTASTLDAFVQQTRTDDFRETVLLGLGTLLRGYPNRDQSRNAAVSVLSSFHQSAKTSAERQMVLRAISNSGAAELEPLMKPLLADPDIAVRADALIALRHMPGQSAENEILNALGDGKIEIVRAGLRAAKPRAPTLRLVGAVGGVAADASDSSLRLAAARLLRQWSPRSTAAQETLANSLALEKNAVVREKMSKQPADDEPEPAKP